MPRGPSESLGAPLLQAAADATTAVGLSVAGTGFQWKTKAGWLGASAVLATCVLWYSWPTEKPPERNCGCAELNNSDSDCCDTHYATPDCKLLDGLLAQSLQLLLVAAGFGSLLLKKKLEESKPGAVIRSYKVWGLDVSKQAASGGCAHVMGIVNAKLLDDDSGGDECSWYSISFTLDTVRHCPLPPNPRPLAIRPPAVSSSFCGFPSLLACQLFSAANVRVPRRWESSSRT